MWRERDGGLLFADLGARTFLRLQNRRIQGVMSPDVLARMTPVMVLAESPNGRIWVGTLNAGLFSLNNGQVASISSDLPHAKINCLLPIGEDQVWVGTDNGVFRWDGAKLTRFLLPAPLGDVQVLSMLRDRDSNIWVGTVRGLARINDNGMSVWDEGQPGNGAINALFEDREGNIWVGGSRGLERIRDSAFLTYSVIGGLPSDHIGPVYVDSQNRTWLAPIAGGLYLLSAGKVQAIKVARLSSDVVYSIAGGNDGEIWIGRQHGGLTRLRYDDGVVTQKTYTRGDGLAQNSVYSVYQARDGTVWSGTLSGGVSKFEHERFVTYTTANGLSSNTVASTLEAQDGTMWFATSNGLSAFSNGQWKAYTKAEGLPSENVTCLYQNPSGVLWIGTSNGLAWFNSGKIQVPGTAPASLHEEILGVIEDKQGWLWVATSHHVLRVQSQKLSNSVIQAADVREYSSADGLLSLEGVKRNASVVADPTGRIWFSLSRGLSVVDPTGIAKSSVPAITHVETILADGKTINTSDPVRIPPSQKRIIVSFTGLSLAVPEYVRFRYMLDGFDRGWSEPLAAREAFYTNLNPGTYRFRVVASNSDGEWNGAETNITFEVRPAYWQTWWFRISFVATILFSVWCAHRLRLLQLTKQFNIRLEERVNERTRIARDLHDTMLQSFQGVLLKFYGLSYILDRPAEARQTLEDLVEQARQAITEGREAVQGMRSSTVTTNDLARSLTQLGDGLVAEQDTQNPVAFHVEVDGETRDLHPLIRDEVYRIASESVRNSFTHSGAPQITVDIHYDERQFRVRVRDNGKGIDPKILKGGGRVGHYGLPGMYERAKLVEGKLTVSSELDSGTEAELTIPASIAYAKSIAAHRSIFWKIKNLIRL
jgi:ligand-binding sensor domain-containing protein/signal transduction histidine kinase